MVLFALDRHGAFILSEGAALSTLGLEPGEVVGRSAFEVYRDEPAVLDCVRRALSGEQVSTILTVGTLTLAVQCSPQHDAQGEVESVSGVVTDVSQVRQAESELPRRLAFEQLLHRVSANLVKVAPDRAAAPAEIDEAIRQALAEVGRFAGADRGYIFEKSPDVATVTNAYEWRADGIESQLDRLPRVPPEADPGIWEHIEQGRVVRIPVGGEGVPQDLLRQDESTLAGIQASVNVPMVSGGRVVGLVGFDWIRSPGDRWPQDEIARCTVLQDLFASALQRKRADRALQRANRVLRAVLECSDALIRARDEEALLQEICRIVVETGGYRLTWVGFGEGDELRSVRPVAKWGFDDGYLDNLEVTWADIERGRGPMGTAIRTRTPVVVESIATDPDFERWRQKAMERGYKSMLAVSLVFGDELLGALGVYAGELAAFDALEVEILQHFADYLAYGIVALRTRARREVAEGQLRESLRSKDELIASISHELRTPLTAVVGFAQVLQDEASGLSAGEKAEMIRSIAEEGLDLTHIVDDLLTAAKAEAGTLTIVPAAVDLRAQAAQVLESFSQGVAGQIELGGPSVRALGDPSRVRQILRNLISNAIRYGGERTRISVGDGATARVQVVDNGPAIPPEERERIFEPYQRAHESSGLTAPMGLGLTISRSLARLMGGDLCYRHEDGESVFELVLPKAD